MHGVYWVFLPPRRAIGVSVMTNIKSVDNWRRGGRLIVDTLFHLENGAIAAKRAIEPNSQNNTDTL
jgi:hypothetical protein